MGSPGYVVAAGTPCAAITTELTKKQLNLYISAWFHRVSKCKTSYCCLAAGGGDCPRPNHPIRTVLLKGHWHESIYHIVQHRHLRLDGAPQNIAPHNLICENWFVKQLLSQSADPQGKISCPSASSIETRHPPMHLLRGPCEDLTGQFLSTWRRSCVSRCWEHSRARKHVPRGKLTVRTVRAKEKIHSEEKKKTSRVPAHTPAKRLHHGVWFVKSTGLMRRLFPKSLLKGAYLLAHKNRLFQERYRGPNPLLHTCLKTSLGSGKFNPLFGCLPSRAGASITVRSLHAPLGNGCACCTNLAGHYSTLYLCRYSVNTWAQIIITQPAGVPIWTGHSAMWSGNEWEQDVSASFFFFWGYLHQVASWFRVREKNTRPWMR